MPASAPPTAGAGRSSSGRPWPPPLGYADGVPRRLFDRGGEVLIGGVRRPLAGVVTMDQVVIDCGPVGSAPVAVGDEVVLIGRQGDEEITADEWAGLLGTISYEVLCDIGPRVPRLAAGGGRPAEHLRGDPPARAVRAGAGTR